MDVRVRLQRKLKNWCFELWCWRRPLRVPWTARRSNQSILKEISPGYLLERQMLKLKLQLWSPDGKNWLIWKDPSAGNDWRQEKKRTTEDEMVGWHHRLNGFELEWTLGVGDGQGGLVCCGLWGLKELDMIEWLNWAEYLSHLERLNCILVFGFLICFGLWKYQFKRRFISSAGKAS